VFPAMGYGQPWALPKPALSVDDFEGIGRFALKMFLVVVGPELPLSWGITDYLQQGLVFGPQSRSAD